VILALVNENNLSITNISLTPQHLGEIIDMINADELSSTNAKIVIETIFQNGGNPREIASEKNLLQTNDTGALQAIVEQVISENATQVQDYKNGNERIF